MTDQPKRLFLSLEMPDSVRGELERFIARLKTGCRFVDSHPKWVDTRNLHVTLVFIGMVASSQVAKAIEAIETVTADSDRFTISIGGAGLFPPNSRNPKVVSSNVHSSDNGLAILHRALVAELRRQGFDIEQRPYKPHLTLARLTSVKTSARLAPLLQSQGNLLNVKFPLTKVLLHESLLSSDGPEYQVLHEANLCPGKELEI